MNQRATSAPYSPMMSSGSTVFRLDFDIFSIEPIFTSSPVAVSVRAAAVAAGLDLDLGRRRPAAVGLLVGLVHHHALGEHAGERLVEPDVAGHLHGAGEEARIEQVQDRVLDAADVLVDRHEAIHHAARGRRFSFHGSVKRAKYHDESTNVSIVSVSRVAFPPHVGHVTCFQVG